MRLSRRVKRGGLLLLAALATLPCFSQSQPPQMLPEAVPSFEVATIKPSPPGIKGYGFHLNGERLLAVNVTVFDMVKWSYNVHGKQVQGLPEWAMQQRWNIEGRADLPGVPNKPQAQGMVRKLLAERFQLTMHTEKKQLSVYMLELLKGPLKFTKSTDTRPIPNLGFTEPGVMVAYNATMRELANLMQERLLDRPVVDKTCLSGRYDLGVDFQPDSPEFNGIWAQAPGVLLPRSDLFTAMQEQLGLKLTAGKDDVEILVVDKLEKPSEN